MSDIKTEIEKVYNELNDSKKATLRTEFLSEFDYKSFDSFYRKLKHESPVYKPERKWLAEKLGKTVEELFSDLPIQNN